jgi:purine-cytosine permease-like protein
MKKYMGNKKEVLLFYLLMIAVIGWFVVAETVYPSERRILHTGGHLPGKK